MKFYGIQKDGKTTIYKRGSMEAFLKSLEGKEVCFDITKVKIKRTVDQNSGLHLLLDRFAESLTELTGEEYTMLRVKGIIGAKFLLKSIYDKDGKYLDEGIQSTAELSLTEMSVLIEKIYAYAADTFGIILPPLEPKE